jgi:hypothetical protein
LPEFRWGKVVFDGNFNENNFCYVGQIFMKRDENKLGRLWNVLSWC